MKPPLPTLLVAAALLGCGSRSGESATGGTSGGGGVAGGGAATAGGNGGSGGQAGHAGAVGGGAGVSGGAAGTGGHVAGTGGGAAGAGTGGGAAGAGTGGGAAGARSAGAGGSGGAAGAGGAAAGAAGGAGGSGGSAGSAAGAGGQHVPSYYLGADVTDQEPAPDAARTDLLTQMKSHGFNYIRVRTFVDPRAADGYDKTNGYDDLAHTIAWGKEIKDAGMGLLLDFHYSDNWADAGKQCVPVAWQSYTTIADLAGAVHDYTNDAITQMIAGGARPDMVQVGNEITPGMLIDRCDSGGQPTGTDNPVTGSISNWSNLGALLKAGSNGVKEVDPTILVALHLDRGNDLASSRSFITNAQNQGVQFDVFGESCYTKYQGQPSAWMSTFTALNTMFPKLKLMIAEYGPDEREANDIIFNLPGQIGIGTFNWEPTTQGDWNSGHDLFRRMGNTYTEEPDVALYDQMKIDYASRL